MTDRPIIFNGPMVRALLDGRKTQTRRVLKRQPVDFSGVPSGCKTVAPYVTNAPDKGLAYYWRDAGCTWNSSGPFFTPFAIGDRLWVRENIRRGETDQGVGYAVYAADHKIVPFHGEWWRSRSFIPSIHMFCADSRLTLTVTDVRVHRVQDISETDAKAEGMDSFGVGWRAWEGLPHVLHARHAFQDCWDSINAKPKPVGGKNITHYVSYPWDGETRTETHRGKPHHIYPNPWVAASSFTVEQRKH